MILKLIFWAAAWSERALAQPELTNIKLLEPLNKDVTEIEIQPGVGTLLHYFNSSLTFFGQVVLGFTVLWVLICGFGVMVSGGDPGKRSEWTGKMMWAIGGLAIILFSGVILRTLNAQFFL